MITKYFYPVAAGIETNILETYACLSKDWDITIHTSSDEYLSKNSLPEKATMRGLNIKRYQYDGELKGYLASIVYRDAGVIALHNFNVFFWRYFLISLYHKLLGLKKYRLIVTPHGGFTPEWSMFPILTRIAKYLYHRIIGSFFINYVADEVRAVSEWERIEMIKMGVKPIHITTITNGLENEAFMDVDSLASTEIKKRVKDTGDYIIQIGRIYPIKNYETVIRALPEVPNIKYVIVGQIEKSIQHANYQKDLLALAKKLNVEDRVIFFGVVRGIDKYYLLKHAKMMVHMALWESFCNVVHEGMSQGLVCIVANNTALPLLVKENINGYLVETKDHISLARKINHVLNIKNSAIIKIIKKNNFLSSENESWSHVSAKMRKLYES